MESDDLRRPRMGVVVTLLDLGNGSSRIIMDDVSSDDMHRDTSWKYECFFTHKQLNSKDTDDMALSAQEYQGIGEFIMARLLALNGRVK